MSEVFYIPTGSIRCTRDLPRDIDSDQRTCDLAGLPLQLPEDGISSAWAESLPEGCTVLRLTGKYPLGVAACAVPDEEPDALRLILTACNALPWYIAEVRRLREENAALRGEPKAEDA